MKKKKLHRFNKNVKNDFNTIEIKNKNHIFELVDD